MKESTSGGTSFTSPQSPDQATNTDGEKVGDSRSSSLQHFDPARPFWRAAPLTPAETELLALVFTAHAASVARDNVSSITLINAFCGSARYTNALAAALCTLGGPHAPIGETWDLLDQQYPESVAEYMVNTGLRVPGWGNSFFRGVPDPLWREVVGGLNAHWPPMAFKMNAVTEFLHQAKDVLLYPNPSAYTAAAALIVGLPRALAPWIFVTGRLTAWTERLAQLMTAHPPEIARTPPQSTELPGPVLDKAVPPPTTSAR